MDPAVLAWALAQASGSRAAALASAYTITHLQGLADHARFSHAHWLRSARQGGRGNYGPAYCIEGAGTWRRRLGELLAQMRGTEQAR